MKKYLEEKLKLWSKAYYEGNPIVSDDIYDSYENLYKSYTDEFNPFEVRQENYRNTIKHWYRLTSLDKTYDFRDIEKKFLNKEFIVEPKLDGMSLALQYVNGILYKAVSRGDGFKGNDVTYIVKPYFEKKYPHLITPNFSHNCQIRGEFLLPISKYGLFEKLGYKVLRSVASGLVNGKEYNELIEHCEFIVHDSYFIENPDEFKEIEKAKDFLRKYGFKVVPHKIINTYTGKLLSKIKIDNEEYEIDGLVFKSLIKSFKIGKNKYPTDAIALKSEDRIQTLTSVEGIEWNMPHDRVIPKFVLHPVEMEGSVVTYATAHNFKFIRELVGKLKKGNVVSLIRAGDIIPQVKEIIEYGEGEDILSEDMIPNKCPICNHELIVDDNGVHLWCLNKYCNQKNIYRIKKLIDILEIKNIGEATINALCKKFNIVTFTDLYQTTPDMWEQVDGLGKKSYTAFKKSADEKLENFGVDELLISLAIPLHGKETIKSFREVWKTDKIKDLLKMKEELASLNNYSYYKFDIMYRYITENASYIQDLAKLIRKSYSEKKEATQGKIIVTGKFERFSRKEFEKILDKLGFIMVTSINEANILLCSDMNSNSSKMKKAKSTEIDIMLYDDFCEKYKI